MSVSYPQVKEDFSIISSNKIYFPFSIYSSESPMIWISVWHCRGSLLSHIHLFFSFFVLSQLDELHYLVFYWLILSSASSHFSSAQFSCSLVSNSLWHHGLQHTRPPCLLPTPRVYSNSCPLSPWCHPTILSSVNSFSSRLQSFPASGSFQMSQFFASGSQSIGVLASSSVLPMNSRDWFPLEWTGWISLQS